MDDNPYAPPSSHLQTSASSTKGPKLSRPASSKWAIGYFITLVLIFAITVERFMQIGREVNMNLSPLFMSPSLWIGPMLSLVCLATLCFGRRAWVYYFVSFVLGIMSVLSISAFLQACGFQMLSQTADVRLMFAIVLGAHSTFTGILFARFVFGKPSRSYYRVAQSDSPE